MERETGDPGSTRYVLMIVLQSVLYGLMDVLSKQAYAVMPVDCFLLLRYLLAALLMLPLWHRRIWSAIRRVPVGKYILPSACMALAFLFSNLALQYTTAANMSFIRSLSTVIVPALLLIFYRQKYTKAELFLQPFILLGLYLLCAKGGLSGLGLGEAFAFIAAALVAGSLVFGRRSLQFVSAETLSFVQIVLAIAACGTMTLLTGTVGCAARALDLRVLLSPLYAAADCTVGGYMLQNVALEHISAKTVGVAQSLYPIAAAAIACAVLGETLSAAGAVGAAILLACVILEDLFVKE